MWSLSWLRERVTCGAITPSLGVLFYLPVGGPGSVDEDGWLRQPFAGEPYPTTLTPRTVYSFFFFSTRTILQHEWEQKVGAWVRVTWCTREVCGNCVSCMHVLAFAWPARLRFTRGIFVQLNVTVSTHIPNRGVRFRCHRECTSRARTRNTLWDSRRSAPDACRCSEEARARQAHAGNRRKRIEMEPRSIVMAAGGSRREASSWTGQQRKG